MRLVNETDEEIVIPAGDSLDVSYKNGLRCERDVLRTTSARTMKYIIKEI